MSGDIKKKKKKVKRLEIQYENLLYRLNELHILLFCRGLCVATGL